MNIFVLSIDPARAARFMCDKHIPKMCVESAQLMACALLENNCPEHEMPLTRKGTRYKGGYKHHPCAKWAGSSHRHYIWLAEHAIELCREFFRRYGKTHACYEPIMVMANNCFYVKGDVPVSWVQAMPDEYKHNDVVTAYRRYYHSKVFAKWDRSTHGVPSWWCDQEYVQKIQ